MHGKTKTRRAFLPACCVCVAVCERCASGNRSDSARRDVRTSSVPLPIRPMRLEDADKLTPAGARPLERLRDPSFVRQPRKHRAAGVRAGIQEFVEIVFTGSEMGKEKTPPLRAGSWGSLGFNADYWKRILSVPMASWLSMPPRVGESPRRFSPRPPFSPCLLYTSPSPRD